MKRYIIYAGVNGAGKTTLYQSDLTDEIREMPRVNVDEIVRSFGRWDAPNDVIEAGMRAVGLIHECFKEGKSFNQETTLCGHSILRNIQRAKNDGYFVEIHYVGVDSPEIAIKRVHQRVLDGGHGISELDIRRRYVESLRNLLVVIPLADKVEIYDNTKAFERIASFRDGKCVYKSDKESTWTDAMFTDCN